MVRAFDATTRETADVVAVAADDGLVAMFTATGIVLLLAISFLAAWANEKDRAGYGRLTDEEARKTLLLHISRDLQLIVYLLCGIKSCLASSRIGRTSHHGGDSQRFESGETFFSRIKPLARPHSVLLHFGRRSLSGITPA